MCRLIAGTVAMAGFVAETESARGAGWTGTVRIEAGEHSPSNPNFSKSLNETTTWTFTGGATVRKDAQGRAVQWNQVVSYRSLIRGITDRSDICGGRFTERYESMSMGYDSGRARIIFGHPSPTPEPMPLPIEVEVTDPDPLNFRTITDCPAPLPAPTRHVTNSLRDPCRVTLGEGRAFPAFRQRYRTKTITDHYPADPGGFLCISSYTDATVDTQLTRLPDRDCDGLPNGRDPARGECPLPPYCPPGKSVARAAFRHAATVSGKARKRLYPKHPVLRVDVKCPDCKSVVASAPVRSKGKRIGRLHARRTRVVRGHATLRLEVPSELFSKIAGALLGDRATYADLKVNGRDGGGAGVRFRKARARFLGIVLKGDSPRTARRSAQQSGTGSTGCTSLVRYVNASVPDVLAR